MCQLPERTTGKNFRDYQKPGIIRCVLKSLTGNLPGNTWGIRKRKIHPWPCDLRSFKARHRRSKVKIQDVSVYASRNGRKNLQKRLSVVFQDYTTSANPRFRVKEIIAEGLAARERNQKIRLDRLEETNRLLELVGLDPSYANRYPHELSGGQLQRVCIARAVACQPEIILFDEAISSLDAHTQVQIMDLLHDLKEKLGLTYIFITHDLTSVTYLCDDVLFLYHGRITEHIPVSHIAETKDNYARKLLASIIEFD